MEVKGVARLRDAHRVAHTGNKAARLGMMREKGLPVPRGFVVTPSAYAEENGHFKLNPEHEGDFEKQLNRIRGKKLAVRSSGLNEDGSDKSYAGVFESILNVEPENVYEALGRGVLFPYF